MAGLTNYWANLVLSNLAQNHYLALHLSDPGTAGLSSSEMTGGSYARQNVTWSTPSARSMANTNQIIFSNLPAGTVNFFAVWDSPTSGNCLYSFAVTAITVNAGGQIIVPVSDVSITLN